ncbi:MAG: type II secretion system F family protein [Betaproteobacteria bacterium]
MPSATFTPLSYRIRAELYSQLAQMEIAGLPFDKAFALLEISGPASARLAATRKLTARGTDPASAGERTGLFTKLDARLIRAALSAGSPGGMYRRLADLYTERAMQLNTMRSRMMMPLFTLALALFLQPLPSFITGALSMGGYLWRILRPLLILGALFYGGRWLWRHALTQSEDGKLGAILLQLPLVGTLVVRNNLRDFFESLALMLEAGVSMLDALPAALETIQLGVMRCEFAQIAPRIEQGANLSMALAGMPYLDRSTNGERLVNFVNTGENSGTLPQMLLRHTKMETESINQYVQQLAEWAPRIFYGMIALWMAWSILTSGAFLPNVPKDL